MQFGRSSNLFNPGVTSKYFTKPNSMWSPLTPIVTLWNKSGTFVNQFCLSLPSTSTTLNHLIEVRPNVSSPKTPQTWFKNCIFFRVVFSSSSTSFKDAILPPFIKPEFTTVNILQCNISRKICQKTVVILIIFILLTECGLFLVWQLGLRVTWSQYFWLFLFVNVQ